MSQSNARMCVVQNGDDRAPTCYLLNGGLTNSSLVRRYVTKPGEPIEWHAHPVSTHMCAHVPRLRMLLCRYYGDWNGRDGSPEKEVVAETRTPQKRNADGSFKVGGSSSLTSQLEREELCARMTEVSHAKVEKTRAHVVELCEERRRSKDANAADKLLLREQQHAKASERYNFRVK